MNNTVMPQMSSYYTQGFSPVQAQAPMALPDDSDRVSGIVGYDVNNYVWGNGQIQSNPYMTPQLNTTQYSQPQNNKGKSSILGAAILGTLVAGGAFIFAKARGHNVSFQSIKNAVVNFFRCTP